MDNIEDIVIQLSAMSDENKIKYMLENQDDINMTLMLDNDQTFIVFPNHENFIVDFDEYIGNSYGISTVLDMLGIKYEYV